MESANSDRHQQPGVLVRVAPEIRQAAQDALKERNWTTNDFVVACFQLVAANPDAMLHRLAQFRPRTRMGRPPSQNEKQPGDDSAPPAGGPGEAEG